MYRAQKEKGAACALTVRAGPGDRTAQYTSPPRMPLTVLLQRQGVNVSVPSNHQVREQSPLPAAVQMCVSCVCLVKGGVYNRKGAGQLKFLVACLIAFQESFDLEILRKENSLLPAAAENSEQPQGFPAAA